MMFAASASIDTVYSTTTLKFRSVINPLYSLTTSDTYPEIFISAWSFIIVYSYKGRKININKAVNIP